LKAWEERLKQKEAALAQRESDVAQREESLRAAQADFEVRDRTRAPLIVGRR